MIRSAATLCLLLGVLTLARADPPLAPKADGGLVPSVGFSHFDVERTEDRDPVRMDRLADLGRALVKTVPVRWGRVVPKAPKGGQPEYRFEDTDRSVLLWQLAGLEPVLVLSPRSPWASMPIDRTDWVLRVMRELGKGDAEAVLSSGLGAAPPRGTHWRAWQQFVQDVVERYDGDGKDDMPGLRRPVRYIQVLDRAELPSRWLGSAEEYMRLLNHAGIGAKTADERCQIVLASIDLRAIGFDPIPDSAVWKHRVQALLPTSPRAARLEMQRAMEWIERVIEMPRLFDVAPHVGSRNLEDDVVNLRHLRHWLDRTGGSDVRIWLVDNPLPKLDLSRVPHAHQPSSDEQRIRKRWVPVARYARHRDYEKARDWLARGMCFDLVRSYCAAHVAGAESVLFFPRADQLPDAPVGLEPGTATPDAFLRKVAVGSESTWSRGPLWHCWNQLVTHVGAHMDVTVGEIGAQGRSVVFHVPVSRKRAWVALLMLDSRMSWAGEPGKPLPTRMVTVPLPNGRYRLESCATSAGEPEARDVAVTEGLLMLTLGPDPVYVIPIEAEKGR